MKTIAIVISSLKAGGMERVASELANNISCRDNLKVVLISLSNEDKFYELASRVIYYPCQYNPMSSVASKAIRYISELRRAFRKFQPELVLSFGDRYNHFTLLASIGFAHRKFISNRQNPNLSNGKAVDFLNLLTYKWANGIIAQTQEAKRVVEEKYSAPNVEVIPNPIQLKKEASSHRDNVILNVGRFGDAKNQFELVEIFHEISNRENWNVHFFGDGLKRYSTEKAIQKFDLSSNQNINDLLK